MSEQEVKFSLRRNQNSGDWWASAIVGGFNVGAIRADKWEAIRAVCKLARLHDRQTGVNGAGRPRSEKRGNGRAECAEAVQRPSGAFQTQD